MWHSLSSLEKAAILCMLLGSIVDLAQFSWLIKKWLSGVKNAIYERAKKEVLLDELNRRTISLNGKSTSQAENEN